MSLDWKPSRGEQRLLWRLRVVVYAISIGAAVYSLASGNTLGLIAFTILATTTEIGVVAAKGWRAARAQIRAIEQEIDRQVDEDDRS